MKYIVGITSSQNKSQNLINNAYIKAFSTETTTPLVIPNLFEAENEIISETEQDAIQEHILKIAKTCDALVLTGGVDLSPVLQNQKITDAEGFNQNRDMFERELVKQFILQDKPILGICRGFQLLGNQLKMQNFQQDLRITNEEHDGSNLGITNRKESLHNVHIFGELKTYLQEKKYNIATDGKMRINSWHHQGFTLLPKGERIKNNEIEEFITGTKIIKEYKNKQNEKIKTTEQLNDYGKIEILMSTNTVIEGFRHKEMPIVAFQYHPEEYRNSPIINYFIEKYINKKEEETEETTPLI